jgi:hypothetical protein
VKRNAAAHRESYLTEVAQLSASLHRWEVAADRSAILAREKASPQFKELRRILNGGSTSGFSRLDIPDAYAVLQEGEDVPRLSLVVKEEIEEVLVPHTEKRFRQHQETPFGQGERKRHLGLDGDSQDAQNILHGTYDRDLDQLSEEARACLTELKEKDFVSAGSIIPTRPKCGNQRPPHQEVISVTTKQRQ